MNLAIRLPAALSCGMIRLLGDSAIGLGISQFPIIGSLKDAVGCFQALHGALISCELMKSFSCLFTME